MKKIILISQNNKTRNTKLTLPIVGSVEFNDKNEIEVDEDKVDELKSKDFGIKLLTEEEMKVAKKSEKEQIQAKQKANVLSEPQKHDLETCLSALKFGRKKDEIEILDAAIQSSVKNKYNKMLETLDDVDLKALLVGYPEEEIKDLKTGKQMIGFLKSKVK